ncbi:MAG TPA: urea ABC transporter permease subunit UrtC [Tepidisphaeraceae bacterium]|jgi:urea transport system permease protein|nr:urea ABC transporter permease subunit UrtC [Tepidisphaeraceae bacterium]
MPEPQVPLDAAAAADEKRSRELYEASQTFLLRMPDRRVMWLRVVTVVLVLGLFFIGIPLMTACGIVPDYKLNILGKYLCFAIVALGIDLIWGYTGLLSLCQALFFALGGYAMAMHLSLKEGGGDVRPEYNNIPQFMFFNNVHDLPGFWKPFASMPFAILAGLLVPAAVAALFGFFILRSRVRGVYFSIVTQALAAAAWLLISRNEMLLGGTNGLTNFYKPMIQARGWIIGLYLLTMTVLVLAYLFCRMLVKSRLGRVLIAVRDKETRLYFAGYKPYAFKVFAFSIGAMLAGVGGMLYSPQVGIITPQNMNVEASIFLVVMVALGGRGRLWGAIFGALLLSVVMSVVSSDLPNSLLLVEGLIAVVVVLFFPDGFAGLWDTMERQLAGNEGVGKAMLTGLPVVTVAIYILAEVLGLMPLLLQSSFIDIPLKFWLLVAILAAAGLLQWNNRRDAANKARARGFDVALLSQAVTPDVAAGVKGGA